MKLKTKYSDGTSHLLFSGLEFVEKLSALVPQPRLHLIRFFGVLAPHANIRSQIVPKKEEQDRHPIGKPKPGHSVRSS
ncbi:transposase [bacterium]|nr:transposase [bacterium]